MKKYLHVISFNIPLPANYGGAICVFYHLKALSQLGVKVILHCYQYGRTPDKRLNELCEEVHYYKREVTPKKLFSSLPFIVNTRQSESLFNRLLEDDYPILFEGSHSCYFIDNSKLSNRTKIVRMHNIEWKYYDFLYKQETDLKKRMYYKWESQKLKKFELGILKNNADAILAISPYDTAYFKENNFNKVCYIPAFHENQNITSKQGRGEYIIFHGDFSVLENEQIALELINLFDEINEFQLILAGRNPRKVLIDNSNNSKLVTLYQNLSNDKMNELLHNAHIHLLRANQPSGMKLKLLNSLYQGRFVLVNSPMVENTGLNELCIIVDSNGNALKNKISELMKLDFDTTLINKRKAVLLNSFDNIEIAKRTLSLM